MRLMVNSEREEQRGSKAVDSFSIEREELLCIFIVLFVGRKDTFAYNS